MLHILNLTIMEKNETFKKIEAGTIKIEDGRIVGLGITTKESISIDSLEKLIEAITPGELVDVLNNIVQRLGSLGLYLFQAGDSIPDPKGALITYTPTDEDLFYISLISKLFRG